MKKVILIILLAAFAQSISAQNTVTTPVTGLSYPIAFDFMPGGKYIITLKGGVIALHNSSGSFSNNFYDLTDSTYSDFERGLLGIEVDPDFASNHFVYTYYVHRCCISSGQTGPQSLRVVRFTEAGGVGTSPRILLDVPVSNSIPGNHVAGNLRVRPSDGKLYVAIGDIGTPAYAQMLTNPFGKILRINTDGTIPTDNPFYDDGNPASGNDDRIWSYGHRNQFDLSFGSNDSLYSSENGQSDWDEVNLITKGKNYGWPDCEANEVFGTGNPCVSAYPSHTAPIYTAGAPLPSFTGIMLYTDTAAGSALNNHLLVADYMQGSITSLALDPTLSTVTGSSLFYDLETLTTLMQGPDGCIYAMKGGYVTDGNISRICPGELGDASITSSRTMLTAFPNPGSGTINVIWSTQSRGTTRLTLHDVTGRELKVLVNEQRSPGTYEETFTVNEGEMPAGSYFCRLAQNGKLMSAVKMMITK